MPSEMEVRLYGQKDRDQWNRYVMRSSNSTCYHLIGWKDVIEKTFGQNTFYLLAEDSEKRIVGILPLVQQKSLFFGNFMTSLPYFSYGGVCADSGKISNRLVEEAICIASKQGANHIEFRHTARMKCELPVKTSKVSMVMELPQEADELWNGFLSKLRNKIKRPLNEGMYSSVGRYDELDSFYSVFSRNMRDLGTPVYNKKFFKNILDAFPDNTHICTIYTKEETPVASGFLIGYKDRMEIPWGSSIRSYNKYKINMLLYWNALKFACNNGYRFFDFGRSTPEEGTYKFKEQWGSRPIQLYWHYWLRNGGPLPELNPKNPRYQMGIKIWQKIPLRLTKIIGPSIVKNLP